MFVDVRCALRVACCSLSLLMAVVLFVCMFVGWCVVGVCLSFVVVCCLLVDVFLLCLLLSVACKLLRVVCCLKLVLQLWLMTLVVVCCWLVLGEVV